MKLDEAKKLKSGLYRIWWKDDTTSLAAVGRTANGTPWLAPINWINVLTGRDAGRVWRLVFTARLIGE
jgi:hypothetical protein